MMVILDFEPLGLIVSLSFKLIKKLINEIIQNKILVTFFCPRVVTYNKMQLDFRPSRPALPDS